MRKIFQIIAMHLTAFFVGSFLAPMLCLGHDERLHVRITESTFQSSQGLNTFLTDNLGSLNVPFSKTPLLLAHPAPFDAGIKLSPLSWLRQGSYWEDMTLYDGNTWRSVDHFYTVTPQRQPGQAPELTDDTEHPNTIIVNLLNAFGLGLPSSMTNSFAWSSWRGISGPYIPTRADVGPNSETWQNARDYEWAALTNITKVDRDENMAHMLYALGHVLHLNQDASQPDHVRNDNHFDEKHRYIENFGFKSYFKQANAFPLMSHGRSWWRDRGFKKLLDFWDRGKYAGNASALNNDAAGVSGEQLGLAEFCNGNFLGEDALYSEYFNTNDIHFFPYPSLQTSTTFPRIRLALAFGTNTSFLKDGTPIKRISIQKTNDGIHIANHSVLNYLGVVFPRRGGVARVSSTINDTNVLQDYHSILIPKAIEYSAGILDYFFRGTMTASVIGYDSNSLQCTEQIVNSSGEDFSNGVFYVYEDNASNVRTLLGQTNFSGILPANSSLNMTFTNSTWPTNKLLLVYRGTIGVTNGSANDPVDAGIAIAVAPVNLDPWFNTFWDVTFHDASHCTGNTGCPNIGLNGFDITRLVDSPASEETLTGTITYTGPAMPSKFVFNATSCAPGTSTVTITHNSTTIYTRDFSSTDVGEDSFTVPAGASATVQIVVTLQAETGCSRMIGQLFKN